MATPLAFPSEEEFLETLGVLPIEAAPEDGYWAYRFDDGSGVTLTLSFEIFEKSIQLRTHVGDRELETVVSEGASRLVLRQSPGSTGFYAEFEFDQGRSRLEVEVAPRILVAWTVLAG